MRARYLALGALALTCAAVAQDAPTPAAVAAETLARGDAQAAAQARAPLAATLATLDRMGVRASEGTADPRPAWRARVGTVAAQPFRGRLLGPAFSHGWLEPGAAMTTTQLFFAGRSATVAVATNPGQPVALGIRSSDTDVRCAAGTRCAWLPAFTQRYTITVRNMGDQGARVFLVVD